MKEKTAGTKQVVKAREDMEIKLKTRQMWIRYRVEVQFTGRLAASIPLTPKEIMAMLEHRMPTRIPPDAIPIEDLAAQVVEEVGADEEKVPGYATFPKDPYGLIYDEGRTWRGHIKDCAGILGQGIYKPLGAFKAKIANRVYIEEEIIPMFNSQGDRIGEIMGTGERFVHGMTAQGMRSSIKYIDYVVAPTESFTLLVLNDGIITPEEHIQAIFEYGSTHGKGQERSEQWGRYRYPLVKFEQVP